MTRRYPAYRASGVEWLDEVPDHWSISALKQNTYLKARVGWKGLNSKEFEISAYAYLVTGSDFQDKFVDWQKCYQVDETRFNDDPFIQLQNGDLLITKDGTIGKLAVVTELDKPACLNSGIFLMRPQNSYATEFLYWVLSSNAFAVFCDLTTYGSTINHLYQNVFENFCFPIPPLAEQHSIVAFLDRETAKIDALVAEQRRLIDLLKEKRQAVISHAVTRGLNPNAPLKPSGVDWLGDVPEEWEIRRLSLVCNFEQGKAHEPHFDDDGEFICVTARFVSTAGEKFKRCSVNLTPAMIGDILMVMSDLPNGRALARAFLVDQSEVYAVNQRVCRISVCGEGDSRYFAYQLNRHTTLLSENDGFNQTHLSNASFTKLKLVVPPDNEQTLIANYLDTKIGAFDALTATAETAIALLQERRAALISAAVTGKIDVRDFASFEATSKETAA